MYRKYNKSDELFSSVFIAFILLLFSAVVIYKHMENWVLVIDFIMIVYFFITAVVIVYFVSAIVIVIINYYHPRIDIELDIKRELIRFRNNKKEYSFKDISLYGRNDKKKETRIMIKYQTYGFSDSSLVDKNNEKISFEEVVTLGKYAINVKHQHLYNFHILVMIFCLLIIYTYGFISNDIVFFQQTITKSLLFIILFGIFIVSVGGNYYHLRYLMKKNEQVLDVKEE